MVDLKVPQICESKISLNWSNCTNSYYNIYIRSNYFLSNDIHFKIRQILLNLGKCNVNINENIV